MDEEGFMHGFASHPILSDYFYVYTLAGNEVYFLILVRSNYYRRISRSMK